MTYNKRHGGPFDRGSADSYYRRPFTPHYYLGGTGSSERIEITEDMEEYKAYAAGFYDNEDNGDYKQWD